MSAYRGALRIRALRAGTVAAWRRADGGWILQVPTKKHWRDKSPLELVRASIKAIGPACARHGIRRIAVPPLGCGLGGLDPQAVRPLLLEAAAAHPKVEWTLHRWPREAPATAAGEGAGAAPITRLGKAEVRHVDQRQLFLPVAEDAIGRFVDPPVVRVLHPRLSGRHRQRATAPAGAVQRIPRARGRNRVDDVPEGIAGRTGQPRARRGRTAGRRRPARRSSDGKR